MEVNTNELASICIAIMNACISLIVSERNQECGRICTIVRMARHHSGPTLTFDGGRDRLSCSLYAARFHLGFISSAALGAYIVYLPLTF